MISNLQQLRLLVVGPTGIHIVQRPLSWALEEGVQAQFVDYRNQYQRTLPATCKFVHLWPPGTGRLAGWLKEHGSLAVPTWIGALHLRSVMASFQPHVVHVHLLDFRTLCCVRAGSRPLIVSAWGSLNHLLVPEIRRVDVSLARQVLSVTDVLIVDNPNIPSRLGELIDRPLRVECLPLGIDGNLFRPGYVDKNAAWRFSLEIPEDATVLFSPRGWAELYGQHLIMEAFALAYPKLRNPTILAFVAMGRSKTAKEYGDQVFHLGVSRGVAHAVRWIPAVSYEEMPGLLALADVVINYPLSDSFPSTLMEAIACARPVITSNLASYEGTFIEEFCTAVEPNNPQALADAIVDMVNVRPEARAPRAEEARQLVLGNYEEHTYKSRLLALYREFSETRNSNSK